VFTLEFYIKPSFLCSHPVQIEREVISIGMLLLSNDNFLLALDHCLIPKTASLL
jgi:hypothetical protein